jgi:hypothetical protein
MANSSLERRLRMLEQRREQAQVMNVLFGSMCSAH